MAHDTHTEIDDRAFFERVDPWVALQDGRRQLVEAIEACDPRAGLRMLAIPEFASLGESTGSLNALLLAHAARDRAHAAFFASLNAGDGGRTSTPDATAIADDWSSVRAEVDLARRVMLESAATLGPEYWERPLLPPWEGGEQEHLASLLIVRAMCDGILAAAIAALTSEVTAP